jgi:hypothetical protein
VPAEGHRRRSYGCAQKSPNENSVEILRLLKMNVSGLIGIGVIVEEEKIGATMPILASPPKGNKPKLIDQVQDLMQRNRFNNRRSRSRHTPPVRSEDGCSSQMILRPEGSDVRPEG